MKVSMYIEADKKSKAHVSSVMNHNVIIIIINMLYS